MSQEELDHVLDEMGLDENLDSEEYSNTPSKEILDTVVNDLPDSAMRCTLNLEVDYRVMVETNDGYVQADLEEANNPGRVEGIIHTADDFLAGQVAESLETDSVDFSLDDYRNEENVYEVTLMG